MITDYEKSIIKKYINKGYYWDIAALLAWPRYSSQYITAAEYIQAVSEQMGYSGHK